MSASLSLVVDNPAVAPVEHAASAHKFACMLDDLIAAGGDLIATTISAGNELQVSPHESQSILELNVRNLSSLLEARSNHTKGRRLARRLADRRNLELAWGDWGCPPPTDPGDG